MKNNKILIFWVWGYVEESCSIRLFSFIPKSEQWKIFLKKCECFCNFFTDFPNFQKRENLYWIYLHFIWLIVLICLGQYGFIQYFFWIEKYMKLNRMYYKYRQYTQTNYPYPQNWL